MKYRSLLTFQVRPGMRDEAVRTFVQGRVLEECAQAVAGFLSGELMLSQEDPDLMYVTAQWINEAAYQQWLASPVRAAQGPALAPFLAHEPSAALLQIVHSYIASPEAP
ncbi:antibiotic biosynthesis monooxygenase [Variovorax sp. Sphag1AA]|uniref:antibiotic biosynthesis monooxygenase family protein n=1 Tax=Variovorax sp. Sphag1AA TaxID=2587027 RepID=UPI00160A50AE|nr:antibiotic biosynthesis monooxygenase family protein [Variovorax sp. Sphag1AA]MBB3178761.1 quinol monooxygenase YgiN [Variovorax sp. Sphag1AA]